MNSAFRIIMELLITFPSAMDGLRSFLEASTIHGLVYISTTKKFIKIFWILVVTLGFTVACYMIREAFIKKLFTEFSIIGLTPPHPIWPLWKIMENIIFYGLQKFKNIDFFNYRNSHFSILSSPSPVPNPSPKSKYQIPNPKARGKGMGLWLTI